MPKRAALLVVLIFVLGNAPLAPISIDNFENGNLNAWTAGSTGQIVVDPLNGSNHALHFTALGDGGDIWTAATYAATGNDWWLIFDYLGTPGTNTGGSIGWDTDTAYAGTERWLASTAVGAADFPLTDDGAWHHYVIHLIRGTNLVAGPVYFKMEDWQGADKIAGNAYFDNIVITDVDPQISVPVLPPVVGALLLAFLLAMAVMQLRRQTSRAGAASTLQ